MSERGLTHLDPLGRARMVDVTPKEATHRRALARCKVVMKPETTNLIASNAISKGDVLAVARVAGIQAAKQAAHLIPLCHPLPITSAALDFAFEDNGILRITSTVKVYGRTGVEMEALTAVSVACLTVYDMCKAVDKEMQITNVTLLSKTKT